MAPGAQRFEPRIAARRGNLRSGRRNGITLCKLLQSAFQRGKRSAFTRFGHLHVQCDHERRLQRDSNIFLYAAAIFGIEKFLFTCRCPVAASRRADRGSAIMRATPAAMMAGSQLRSNTP